jgi:hypothetical protein
LGHCILDVVSVRPVFYCDTRNEVWELEHPRTMLLLCSGFIWKCPIASLHNKLAGKLYNSELVNGLIRTIAVERAFLF